MDSRFSLIDEHGELVWMVDRPDEYDDLGGKSLYDFLQDRPGICEVAPGRFTVDFPRERERITFTVVKANGEWVVMEESSARSE